MGYILKIKSKFNFYSLLIKSLKIKKKCRFYFEIENKSNLTFTFFLFLNFSKNFFGKKFKVKLKNV